MPIHQEYKFKFNIDEFLEVNKETVKYLQTYQDAVESLNNLAINNWIKSVKGTWRKFPQRTLNDLVKNE